MEMCRAKINLNDVEKTVEEIMNKQLVTYIKEEEIVLKNHHFGRRGYSTVTAKAVIDEAATKMLKIKMLLSH